MRPGARTFEPSGSAIAVHAARQGKWALDHFLFAGTVAARPVHVGDVVSLLDQLSIPKAIFVGTSLGGIVTMTMASRHLDRVAGAVLNDVGPVITAASLVRIGSCIRVDDSLDVVPGLQPVHDHVLRHARALRVRLPARLVSAFCFTAETHAATRR